MSENTKAVIPKPATMIVLPNGTEIHPTAIIGYQPMQSLALGRRTHEWSPPIIGANCRIGAYAIVYAGVKLGDDCLVGEHAVIREGCRIGDRCLIGQAVFVNYEAQLGDDVRVTQGVNITGLARIGSGVFFGPSVTMSNQRHIDVDDVVFDPAQISPPVIGDFVMVGTGANIVAGVTIGDRAVIAAGAVVARDVPAGGVVRGQPARLMEPAAAEGPAR
jgi:acetyltransferase-like isoleucine patch superfamily enzyme